ncbi:MAG: hypothetical protein MH204_11355 [Fimbriimonadaceae bacterium]|nr:hypothetical protein [Fimbriimonadaceae bacterium]
MRARPVLVVDDAAVDRRQGTLSLEVLTGDAYAVMGPLGAMHSDLLRLLAVDGDIAKGQGRVFHAGRVVLVEPECSDGRLTPQRLIQPLGAERGLQVLQGLGLVGLEKLKVSSLVGWDRAACDLAAGLAERPDVLLVAGCLLDRLDPWQLPAVLSLFDDLRAEGLALLVETARPDIAEALEGLIVFSLDGPVFAGLVEELLESEEDLEFRVETDDRSAAAQLAGAFAVRVEQTAEGIRFSAPGGQEQAARLLAQGCGTIRAVAVRRPTLSECLLGLVEPVPGS